MALNRYNLNKTLKNIFVLWVLLLLCNFTFSRSKILYSSSRNDLSDYKHFSVSSSYDGSFIINVMDDKNRSIAIHALLQNGSTIYIDLNFLNKDIKRIFPLNMKHYLLLYNNDNNQSTGIVLDWSKKVVKDNIFIANNTVENSKIGAISDLRLSSFIISSQDIEIVNWIVYNSSLHFIFPTTDGSYGFITTESSYEINNILNEPVPIVSIYYMFLTPLTHQISKKFLLHYARNVSEISYISCSSSYSEIVNVCLITELHVVENFQNSLFITYQVDFLSSGSVVGVHALYFQFMHANYSSQYDIQPLFYGGAVITSWSVVNSNIIKRDDAAPAAVNSNDKEICNLTPINTQFYVMKNNTYTFYVDYSSNEWDIFVIDLPKFKEDYKATCVVRLTQDGTRKYDSLSPSEKTEFLNNFRQELIISIPINSERLQLTNRIQYDPSVSSQYLLQIEILPTKDLYQDSVSQIVKTMKELIKDENTIIYMNNYTKYLDYSYGIAINLNLWDELKWKLLGLLIGCIILLAIALWARYKYPEGQSFTICRIAFIFVGLILDILFIAKNGKDVPWLYFPSADITLFEFLTSKFAGFEIFNAPISDFTTCWIYWGTIINIFIKNIPQLVIQILYYKFTVKYETIPFLTLLTSSIALLNTIILKLFKYFSSKEESLHQTTYDIVG
ncbi:hypothetical protein C2G38_2162156 [Gigaspora rosea]|uniref:Uncharacterized protein n=1 Tax=Gigaspora rosea TaxID=44941 RepID=A0A397VWA4_9GLOM|nr:hypothetical protein C2G38_2162156 [Gigaspora rosea]